MNYLAHAFLAGNDPEVLIGSMAADSLKGTLSPTLQQNVVRGILLHRKIDQLNDFSDEFSACMTVFRPLYGRYSHVLVDIAFDHILIGNWGEYSQCDFHSFVQHVYEVLQTKHSVLPKEFIPVADRICSEDWLTSYESLAGVATAYERIAFRMGIPKGHFEKATTLIEQRRDFLNAHFNALFRKLVKERPKLYLKFGNAKVREFGSGQSGFESSPRPRSFDGADGKHLTKK